ncbi:MCE family protein [Williamsia sterculiae]|uniref:Phospholipid/cholesterol/gamma-HCH transport system substrate-binding protein n=1 Tax=Williamsia sterculiae TaxID=1344003 RepID=A0A1N7D3P9_9NOCA|nr:MCE family protein [Williamsia sterculiae]SIR70508.1 phospholipid/cholesterol/gamma-HCH transport system substrate-binding protein [Williamsia sterculiae]
MRGLLGPLVKLVVFAVVTVVATALLGITMANSGTSGDDDFTAIFSDAVLLNKGDDVRVAGVRVGQVTEVKIHDRSQAEVKFNVNRKTLPDGVQAYIRFKNLQGQRYVALEKGAGDPSSTISSGSTIPLSQTHPSLNLNDLFNGLKPLFQQLTADDVNKLSNEIIQVFQGESGTVSELISDTSSLTNTLADRDRVIGELITNLTTVLKTVNDHDDQFTSLLQNTSAFVSGLAAQRGSVGSAITSLANLTGVTNSILSPTRPAIQGSISALNQVAGVINSRQKDLEKTLSTLPVKAQKIGRAATFGSWFQFYLCGLDIVAGNGKSTVLTQPLVPLPDINHVLYTNAATRCWSDNRPG